MSFYKYNLLADTIYGGYVYSKINPILEQINNFHKSLDIHSGICEIGLFQGKSFLALCCVAHENETCLGIDSFGDYKKILMKLLEIKLFHYVKINHDFLV